VNLAKSEIGTEYARLGYGGSWVTTV
jgi:hypothetical protein